LEYRALLFNNQVFAGKRATKNAIGPTFFSNYHPGLIGIFLVPPRCPVPAAAEDASHTEEIAEVVPASIVVDKFTRG
jgi:hypothetical protein